MREKVLYYVSIITLAVLPVLVNADTVSICKHYRGADATFTQGTDTGPIISVFYGEACAFKFNIQATVHDSPWHQGISYPDLSVRRDMNDVGRLDYSVYMQTVEGNAGDLTYPYGTNVVEEQVRWHNATFGFVPSVCAYQGGQYSYANFIHEYLLAGRSSAPDGNYEYGPTTIDNTKFYKLTTRMGDLGYTDYSGISNSMALLDEAITNGGWYRDFNHWHTNPEEGAPTLYEFYEAARQHINASGKRVACIGVDTAIQYRWLRDISSVSVITNGNSMNISVTYNVPSWMMVAWVPTYTNYPDEHLRPVDGIRIPVSVKVDLSGTPLSGDELYAAGASSLRKLDTDLFVVEVPFNKTNETVTVTLSPTNTPSYSNDNLPLITSITQTGTNWQVTTDRKTSLSVFSLPAGKTLADMKAKEAVYYSNTNRVDAPIHQVAKSTTHSFSLATDTNRDFYIGVITEEQQSVLAKLEPVSSCTGEYPAIRLNGDNPMDVFVNTDYIEPGATACDLKDGDITSNIIINASNVDTSVIGVYSVTYDVTDSDNNSTQVVRTVNVILDNVKPEITLLGDNPLHLLVGDSYVEAGATAMDNVDGDISSNIVIDSSSVNTSTAGTYYVTYNVSDSTGNAADEVVRTVYVNNPMPEATTFLMHFNDTNSWNVNPANGDAASGSTNATVAGNPAWDTGFFPGSSPANKAFYATNSDDSVTFPGNDGNIDYISSVSGGLTVGFWCRIFTTANPLFGPIKIESANEYLYFDYGYGQTGKMRVRFRNGSSYPLVYGSSSLAQITNGWVYFAVTVDLSASEMTIYQYDSAGNAIGAPATVAITSDWKIKDAADTKITIGGDIGSALTMAVDELSIDNYVLTQTQIESRVSMMVAGTEIGAPDTTPPVITLLGNNPTNVLLNSTYIDAGATAHDNVDGDITANIVVSNTVDTAVTGTYYVAYNVQDSSSNAATEVRRIVNVVSDITPPVITLLGSSTVYVNVGDSYTDAGATAHDDVDGDITANIVTVNPVDTSVPGTYYVTYNVTDSAGNAAPEVKRTVIVSAATSGGSTTLRLHFNDSSSWNVNTNNDDYAVGSTNATVSGTPLWNTGFFPGSSPANQAFYVTNTAARLNLSANDGNVPITNPTGSVMTVGFWWKITGAERWRPVMIRDSGYGNYLMMDYGVNVQGKWTMIFNDNGAGNQYKTFSTVLSSYVTNWIYTVTTVDLADKTIRVINYDDTGTRISTETQSIVVDGWDVTNGSSVIVFNYGQTGTNQCWLDEFTIDNRELSLSEIKLRVDKMVSGTQLSADDSYDVPSPGTPPPPGNMTFLNHFNDNTHLGWDINSDNGDFAAGDYTAGWIGNPEWQTGFFTNSGASIPANRCFSSTNAGVGACNISFDANNGNVEYTSPTSGGITVGCWAKVDSYAAFGLFSIGTSSDYVKVWYGPGSHGAARIYFYDNGSGIISNSITDTSAYISDWIYFALTVDLDKQQCTLRQYDNSGNKIAEDVVGMPVTDWDVKGLSGSTIKIGDYLSSAPRYYIDEFSIDNYVLSSYHIQNRVNKMIDGKELDSAVAPTGMFMIIR